MNHDKCIQYIPSLRSSSTLLKFSWTKELVKILFNVLMSRMLILLLFYLKLKLLHQNFIWTSRSPSKLLYNSAALASRGVASLLEECERTAPTWLVVLCFPLTHLTAYFVRPPSSGSPTTTPRNPTATSTSRSLIMLAVVFFVWWVRAPQPVLPAGDDWAIERDGTSDGSDARVWNRNNRNNMN